MLKSKRSKPCFYLRAKADVTEFIKLRPKLRKSLGTKITTNAFYVRSLAKAAQKFPLMLGKLDGEYIKIAESVNVGFAVNAPHGLVVPVIKQAEQKTIVEIAQLEKLLTEKARSNKLSLVEMEDETIALSNLGAYNVDSFIGIVPMPVATILSVGNAITEVVSCDGGPQVRKIVNLSLAVDHRVVNGSYAAQFLNCITELLQKPQQLT